MRLAQLLAIAALCVFGATGCFRIGVTVGSEIAQDRVEGIVPGQTTRAQILEWFGAPVQVSDGEIFTRMFDAGEIAAEDLVALPFADLLVYEITDGNSRIMITFVFNWARVEIKRDRLVIFFDRNDVVLYYGITRQREVEEEKPPGPREHGVRPVSKGPGR